MTRTWILSAALGAVLVGCQSSPPSEDIALPPRAPGAPDGTALRDACLGLDRTQREEQVWQQLLAGNLPDHLRRFVPVTVTRADRSGTPRELRFDVLPDYLSLGSDDDFFRMPLTPGLAQRIADRLDCVLPTPRMVDDIWAAADLQLRPQWFSPDDHDITSVEIFWRHDRRIDQQSRALPRAGRPLGLLVAGIKKDLVVTRRLLDRPDRVAIYGWHHPDGKPIQPLYTGHVDLYVDYSHGVRLVRRTCWIDGRPTTIDAVLDDPELCILLTDESPGAVRYNVSTETSTSG